MAPEIQSSGGLSEKRFIFSLALALFGTSMLDVLSSLFLIDLSKTFLDSTSLTTIAIMSQIVTISSIVGIVFGILSGFLSVRVNHKHLLLFGAVCIVIGAVGCLLAPSLLFLQIFYPFDAIGTIIVSAMAFTLIGEWLPVEKRARSIGVVTSAGILSIAIGFAIAGFAANSGGWRSYLAWYVLPVAIAAVFLAFFLVPKRSHIIQNVRPSFSAGFKQVMLNKSATACLVSNSFITAGGVWSFFAATFWRKQYLLDVQVVAIITVAVVLVYSLGGFLGGRLVNRVGRKRFVVFSWFSRGLLIAAIVLMPDMWSALFASFVATLIGGFSVTGGHSLFLEQAPESRGTMMSMSGVFASAGWTLGVSMGGLALVFGFVWLGLLLGIFCIVAALIILLLSREPCKGLSG